MRRLNAVAAQPDDVHFEKALKMDTGRLLLRLRGSTFRASAEPNPQATVALEPAEKAELSWGLAHLSSPDLLRGDRTVSLVALLAGSILLQASTVSLGAPEAALRLLECPRNVYGRTVL